MPHRVTALVVFAGAAVSASAQTALLREGDVIGPGDYTVSSFGNVGVMPGGTGYAVRATIEDEFNGRPDLSIFWGSLTGLPPATFRTEQTFPPIEQVAFESFWGMNDDGQVAYSPSCNDTSIPRTNLDSVWVDDVLIAIEGMPFTAQPGQFHRFSSRPTMDNTGRPWWVGGITNVQFGTTQNQGIYRGSDPEVVIQGGMALPNLPQPLSASGSGISFDFRVSASGTHYILAANMATGSSSNDETAIMDGAGLLIAGELAREGAVVPVAAGGDGVEAWSAFDFFGVNEAGDYMFTGDTNGSTATDEFILANGNIILREGATVPTPVGDGTLRSTINAFHMNEQGDWAASWEVAVPAGNAEIILVNGIGVVMEGTGIDFDGDGIVDANATLRDITGISNLAISPRLGNTVTVYFIGSVDTAGTTSTLDDLSVYYALDVAVGAPCPADLSGSSDPNDPAYGVPDGAIDASDFFYYLDQVVAGNLAIADLSGSSDPNDPAYGVPDGAIDASDFFYYLDIFVQGCR